MILVGGREKVKRSQSRILRYNRVSHSMSHRLKILQIISSWGSGVGSELAEFAARLPREEWECEICVLAGSNSRRTLDLPTTTLDLRWSVDINTALGVRRILRRFRPDVVHTWDFAAQCYGVIHRGPHRIIAETRENDLPKGWLQQYLLRKTHRWIVPRQNETLPATRTTIIPPAAVPVPWAAPMSAEELFAKLDFPLVEPSGDYYPVFQPQYEPARRNYKPIAPPRTPFVIGIILPLCAEHRILDALWVFETLNHVHLNFHALIIGDGKDRELFLRSRDQWKLSSRVHFLGNRHNDRHLMGRLLPSLDVLLHLSDSAEHAGTTLSAMSCGVPVIALETPESREYIVDGITGILIPNDGDFRFYRRTAAKKLLYLLENETLRRSMQTAAKEHVATQFDFETAMRQRIQVYRELCTPQN